MRQPTLTCVTYHHFAAEPTDAVRHLGITTPPDTFRAHLDYFAKHFQIVGLDEVLSGALPPRPLLITIDDAYRSVIDIAAPLLRERRMPAVLFTNPAVITDGHVPLDTLLSLAVSRCGLPIVAQLVGEPAAATLAVLIQGPIARLGLAQRMVLHGVVCGLLGQRSDDLHRALGHFMSPKELQRLPGLGIEIANHTTHHVHCRSLSAADLRSEIAGSKQRLEALAGRSVRAFSFPYGNARDATPAALAALRASGHYALFLVHARTNRRRPAADIWYRTSLTDAPAARLRWQIGVLPTLRAIKSGLQTALIPVAA